MPESLKEEKYLNTLNIRWLTGVLLFFMLYATLRYIVLKGVDPIHFPLYIFNKVISISGIFFLALSYTFGKIGWLRFQDKTIHVQFIKFTGLIGFSLSAIHVFMSLLIISPAYFPKFYEGDMMNLKGELSMLMGVFSLYFFTIPAITTIPFMQKAVGIKKWQKGQRMGYFGLLTALVHTGVMGFSSWFDIDKWPGYLPPITLIGVTLAFIPLFIKVIKK